MDSRREFIKKAAMIAGMTGFNGVLPSSIQKALAIDPAPGSTWMDAEHVVILMQENRSFDHAYGNLKGVRGYRDPRAMTLPDGNPVWLQTNAAGESYLPFRLDIKDTKATWMGCLPHSWTNQLDARNDGKHDRWLHAKQPGTEAYEHMPLTLGYYDRRDIPFYYVLADAFTICDQNFCSCLTGTTPNRLYLWSGTIRDKQDGSVRPRVRNEDTDYPAEASWSTFPERLEDNGIDWKIYQNEIGLHPGFKGEEDPWLSNFGDNPIEWFTQYHIRMSPSYFSFLPAAIDELTAAVSALREKSEKLPAGDKARVELENELKEKSTELDMLKADREKYTAAGFEQLPEREKSLHRKAFTNNLGDPQFRELADLSYHDGEQTREMKAPKGDLFHQFRSDVREGKLPTVSWLVAPENFSDHPAAPWYGAWYVSEALDILTSEPEVWKKTIFILCYDENDGYFDHVPPFTAPDPLRPETGKTAPIVDTSLDYMTREQDLQKSTEKEARGGPIGLGYRVPLVICSPWSRGGYVNSQVFDHTSVIQLLETFVSHKKGVQVQETNISPWRRMVCGDLSSVFRPYDGQKKGLPEPLVRDVQLETINKARYRGLPGNFKSPTKEEVAALRKEGHLSALLPEQERGTRPSCALPYELYAGGGFTADGFAFTLRAGNQYFGNRSVGAPFIVHSYGENMNVRNYAVAAGNTLTDQIGDAGQGLREVQVHGPNGFYRGFRKGLTAGAPVIELAYETGAAGRPTGRLLVNLEGEGVNGQHAANGYTARIKDHAYGRSWKEKKIGGGQISAGKGSGGNVGGGNAVGSNSAGGHAAGVVLLDTSGDGGWYDFSLTLDGLDGYVWRFAGRVETGKDSISDPAMG